MALEQADRELLHRVDTRTLETLELAKTSRTDIHNLTAAWNDMSRMVKKTNAKLALVATRVTRLEERAGLKPHNVNVEETPSGSFSIVEILKERDARTTWWVRWGAEFFRMLVIAVVASGGTIVATYLARGH